MLTVVDVTFFTVVCLECKMADRCESCLWILHPESALLASEGDVHPNG